MKSYRKTSRIVLVATFLALSWACDSFLDVNEDPTSPAAVAENLQLPALLGEFSYEVIGNEPSRTTSLWIQQTAYTGFAPSADNYDHDEADVNNMWNWTYAQVLNNSKQLDELATSNGNYAYSGIAKVIQAWSFAILTDLWGDIPYTEAHDPTNTTPAYDTQEFVYEKIFELLNGAVSDFQQASPLSPGADDLLYGGDMDKWERLTYSLIARYNLRLSEAPGNTAATRAQAALTALANGFQDNSDDADFAYYNQDGSQNPWFQFAIDGKWDTRNQLSTTYVTMLNNLNDPRLKVQARAPGAVDNNGLVAGFSYDPDTTTFVGHINGLDGNGATGYSSIGNFYSDPDAPLTWMSYAELKFIEAEATLISSGAAAAQPIYLEAIQASMDKLGVDAADATTYIAGLPLLTASTDPLEDLIVQKSIANFLSLEVFNDWRRTGYPVLTPITNNPRSPSGAIPVRYPYPFSEMSNNADNVASTGVPSGVNALETKVWWDAN